MYPAGWQYGNRKTEEPTNDAGLGSTPDDNDPSNIVIGTTNKEGGR